MRVGQEDGEDQWGFEFELILLESADLNGLLAVTVVPGPSFGSEASSGAEPRLTKRKWARSRFRAVGRIGPSQGRVAETPAIAFALAVAKELLDLHPLVVEFDEFPRRGPKTGQVQ